MFNWGKHQKFFAHLFDEGNAPDAKLQKKVLAFRYFHKLSNDNGSEEKDHDIDDVMGMMHAEAISWFGKEKIEGKQADDGREERGPGTEEKGAGNRCNQIDINQGHGINKILEEKVQQGNTGDHKNGEQVVLGIEHQSFWEWVSPLFLFFQRLA